MERKTKHRILGIIVIAALVVALLPLFHGGNNDVKLDPKLINAPPFPDQSAQASDNSNPEFKMALANQTSPIPIKNNQDYDSGVNQQPDDTINPKTSQAFKAVNKQPTVSSPSSSAANPQAIQPGMATNNEDDNDSEAVIKSVEKNADQVVKGKSSSNPPPDTQTIFRNSLESEFGAAAKPLTKKAGYRRPIKIHESPVKMKQAKLKHRNLPLDNNGLFKLKNSAWVIQLGSYKNKTSALKLVNRLRANGYSAFIQEAALGTSVYVGPEIKEGVARSLAARLEYEMKIQGFVISYKPLTL